LTFRRLFHRVACVLAVVALVSGGKLAVAAKTVVVGTSNPEVNVPAVQDPFNRGGEVKFDEYPKKICSDSPDGLSDVTFAIEIPLKLTGRTLERPFQSEL
jgi:hypothetical protein